MSSGDEFLRDVQRMSEDINAGPAPGGNGNGEGAPYTSPSVIEAITPSDTDDIPDLAELLDTVAEAYTRHVRFPNSHAADALALFTAETHVAEVFDVAPYVNIYSPDKRCGKSRVLEVGEQMVARPLRVSSASPAFLFRAMKGATLFLDEADKVFAGKDDYSRDLVAALNSGWRKGSGAGRIEKADGKLQPVQFDAFGPKVLAGIGRKVPDTVADRAIPVFLQRKAPGEAVARFRLRLAKLQMGPIREGLERWARTAAAQLAEAEPELPSELNDRAQDVWEPLLAIADLAGRSWPERARTAALALHGEEVDDDSLAARLLRDILAVYTEAGADRMSSADMVAALNKVEESPWGGWPLNQNGLAKHLRAFKVRSKNVRLPDGKTPKGYHADQFEDVWRRYLPSSQGVPPQAPQPPHDAKPQPARLLDVAGVADVADTPKNGSPAMRDAIALVVSELDAEILPDPEPLATPKDAWEAEQAFGGSGAAVLSAYRDRFGTVPKDLSGVVPARHLHELIESRKRAPGKAGPAPDEDVQAELDAEVLP